MNSRSDLKVRGRRNTKHIVRTSEVRKRKGRATSTSDCPGNEVKRNCIQSPMALRVEQPMPTHLVAVDECSLDELTLEANELLDSPRNKAVEDIKRIKTRSYTNRNNNRYVTEISNLTTYPSRCPPINGKRKCPLPELVWADPDDVWESMKIKEQEYQRDPCYLKKHPSLQVRMRSILLDWLIEVCEVYRLHRETFHLTIDFIDRYLATQSKLAKQRLQLIGVTSLFIASKIEEIYPPKLTEFAYVTDGACTCDEITKQELLILQALKWKLSPVTPNSWLMAYLQIDHHNGSRKTKRRRDSDIKFEFPDIKQPLQISKVSQLIDLCLLDMASLKYPYSIIASSCVHHLMPQVNILEVTGHTWNELSECVEWLNPFAQIIRQQKINPVKQFEKVSPEDAHNIQVHNSGLSLLDQAHQKQCQEAKDETISRTSPVQCEGILTPPSSTKKEY